MRRRSVSSGPEAVDDHDAVGLHSRGADHVGGQRGIVTLPRADDDVGRQSETAPRRRAHATAWQCVHDGTGEDARAADSPAPLRGRPRSRPEPEAAGRLRGTQTRAASVDGDGRPTSLRIMRYDLAAARHRHVERNAEGVDADEPARRRMHHARAGDDVEELVPRGVGACRSPSRPRTT